MKKSQRLYYTTKPKHYDVHLNVDREAMTFTGSVKIQAEVSGALVLHSKHLEISSARVDGQEVSTSHDEETDELSLDFTTDTATDATVELDFSGTITDPMTGMYPCYFKHEGHDKKLIATQFESHHAREVLPCIDEPEAKATFQLTLEVPYDEVDNYISNTSIESEDIDGNMITVRFEKTPIMSSYLLAFVYGEVNYLEGKSSNGTAVRTWATPDNYKNTEFALDVAIKTLDFYNEYFGIDYPLAKCDHIALPDFAAGAMENWGCITYRESVLLVDDHTTTDNKQYVAIVIAHEMTHQWFGNLVTMQWWNDLWLNEGFASWMEYLAIDSLFPEWQLWTQFVIDDYMRGQSLDSLASTHPIEVPIDNPDEIRSIFDAISYNKGASVIRMLHDYIGPQDFKKGIGAYLKKHSYDNTVTTDLWNALSTASGKAVGSFMGAWTSQAGYPLLSASYNAKGSQYDLTQERFYINPIERAEASDETLWPIPIDTTASSDTLIMTEKTSTWPQKSAGKLNTDQTGFYLVKHDYETLKQLMEQIETKELDPIDRLGLLNDNFQLAKAGMEPTAEVMELIRHYHSEDNAAVWDEISADIASVRKVMGSDELRSAIKPYLKQLSAEQYERLGWTHDESEPYFDTLLRPTILSLASIGENQEVVDEALKRFSASTDLSQIAPDLRGVVLGTAVRKGGRKEFDIILKNYLKSQSSQQKSSLAAALCSFEDDVLTTQARDMIMTKDVRLQEVISWFAYLMGNRHSRMDTWNWLKDNWDWFVKNFGTDIMTFSYVPAIAGRAFSDSSMYDEYLAFFKGVNTDGIEQKVAQGAEALQWQGAWRDRDYSSVLEYFTSQ